MNNLLISNCKKLLDAYKSGQLGQTVMPEDSHPNFKNQHERLIYFTLPMALNYQRDSYKLWQSALKTFRDKNTEQVFDLGWVSSTSEDELKGKLLKHHLALQPNKNINIWKKISETIYKNWGSLEGLFNATNNDFLQLKHIVQKDHKKGFPYLSGPKIFNYWSFIISTYGKQKLLNRDLIDIAPDTHITKCSVILGVISEKEALDLSKDDISGRWRKLLSESNISPIDMHPPLWFWSKNGFIYNLE